MFRRFGQKYLIDFEPLGLKKGIVFALKSCIVYTF